MIKQGKLEFPQYDSFIGFDAEWTKNYKIKNGNKPFCFSFISINKKDLSFENLRSNQFYFKYVQFYCENELETDDLVCHANETLNEILACLDTSILCGHQISSDLSVLRNSANNTQSSSIKNISKAIFLWQNRKTNGVVFDTRYDVSKPFLGKSRRLVDMCNDFRLNVEQPELGKASMTKLQNIYYSNNETTIRERISVLNLRHCLSTILLTWLGTTLVDKPFETQINVNNVIRNVLGADFNWVQSEAFSQLFVER